MSGYLGKSRLALGRMEPNRDLADLVSRRYVDRFGSEIHHSKGESVAFKMMYWSAPAVQIVMTYDPQQSRTLTL